MTTEEVIFDPDFVLYKTGIPFSELDKDLINFIENNSNVRVHINSEQKELIFFIPETIFQKHFNIEGVSKKILKLFCKNAHLNGLKTILKCDENGNLWITFEVNHKMIKDAEFIIKNYTVSITPRTFSFATTERLRDCLDFSPKERYSMCHDFHDGQNVLIFRAKNSKRPINGVFFSIRHLPEKSSLYKLYVEMQKENSSLQLTAKVDKDGRACFTFEICENVGPSS
ncbi:MAG: hypothetical protein PHF88_01795 [Candidatus Pacebacteria bacterium]|nr:hypothetical protein [Candidatus Paceibacterota bacterium]